MAPKCLSGLSPTKAFPRQRDQGVVSDKQIISFIMIRALITRWPYQGTCEYLETVPLGKWDLWENTATGYSGNSFLWLIITIANIPWLFTLCQTFAETLHTLSQIPVTVRKEDWSSGCGAGVSTGLWDARAYALTTTQHCVCWRLASQASDTVTENPGGRTPASMGLPRVHDRDVSQAVPSPGLPQIPNRDHLELWSFCQEISWASS